MTEYLCRLKNCFDDNGKRRSYFGLYTVLFCITAFFIFSWFIFSGKSLIYQGDGWIQHFKALIYYGQYLRKIIKELLFNHRIVIPDWDFYIGEGSDVLSTLHYYTMGDPIALLSVFVPTRFMHYFYTFSCILRLYLAGIAFSTLCFGTGVKNRCGILAGALSYCFCSWAALNAGRHPFFLNPMIYFPLIILGIEKIIHSQRPYLFIIMIAISAASNFYFFYMIVLLTIVYTFIRLLLLYKNNIKEMIKAIFKIGLTALLGIGISALIFLPVLYIFLQDSRFGETQTFHWLYPLSYYSQLPAMAITKNKSNWLCLGYSVPVILSMFMLLLQKGRNRLLKALFWVCVGLIVFPVGGKIFNGMSYVTNRWVWAFALLAAYTLAVKWEPLFLASSKEWNALFIVSLVYYAVCLLFDKSRNTATLSAVPLFFISLICFKGDLSQKKYNKRQFILLAIVIISNINVEFWRFSPGADNYIAEFLEYKNIWTREWPNNETSLVKAFAKESYPRYTGRSITENANIVNEISNTQYYWSLSNPYLNQFRSDLAMRESFQFRTYGYDDRTAPIALSATGYYVTKPNNNLGIPYGYKLLAMENSQTENTERYIQQLKAELNTEPLSDGQIKKISQAIQTPYLIYENQYKLPLGYSYYSYTTRDAWESLDPVQKQEIQLSAAVLNVPLENLHPYDNSVPDYTVSYVVEPKGQDITTTDHSFITTADNTQIVLQLEEPVKDAEVYVGFEDLKFKITPEYDLYFGEDAVDPLRLYSKTNWELLSHDKQLAIRRNKLFIDTTAYVDIAVRSSAGASKQIRYVPPDHRYYSGRHNFVVNLGFTTDEVSSLAISLPKRGVYSFQCLKVYKVPMEGYAQKIEALSKDSLQNISIDTNRIQGEFSADSDRILCLAVPYSKGWSVYVDGQKQDVLLINGRHIGASLAAGHHTVRFEYHTLCKREGLVLSIVSLIILLVFVRFSEKNATGQRSSTFLAHADDNTASGRY